MRIQLVYFSQVSVDRLYMHLTRWLLSQWGKWGPTALCLCVRIGAVLGGLHSFTCTMYTIKQVGNSTRKLCYRKGTAQCAIYMDAIKFFGTSWLRPRLLFPTFFVGFCSNRLNECFCKIWSPKLYPFLRQYGVSKKFGQSLDTPTLPFLQNF